MSPVDSKAPNSQLTQEQLAVLLNLLGQSKSAVNPAQIAKVNPETLQQLSKVLPPEHSDSDRPPEPHPPLKPHKLPQSGGAPRTPPMPKPPSPHPSSASQGKPDGEASAATQTAVTMLLAQLLQAQQRQEAGDTDGTNAPAGGPPPPPSEPKLPPEPIPVSPGNYS